MSHSGEAIFVGIASYCDTELDLTLTQLFDKAKDASRVYVGLVGRGRTEWGPDGGGLDVDFEVD